MTNADMVICSGSSLSVQRYWSTQQATPSNGEALAGATCTQSGGKTVMTFTRDIASSGSQQNAIKVGNGENTNFVYAFGNANTLAYHASRGRKSIDVNAVTAGVVTNNNNPTTTTTTPPSKNDKKTTGGKIEFDSSFETSVTLSEDKSQATFVATLSLNGWLAIGVGGAGMKSADMVICSDLKVKRYWSTAQSQPSNGIDVKDATCTQTSGKTVMTFTRNTAKSGSSENDINTAKGTLTNFIWAYGASNSISYHNANRGAMSFDVASGVSSGTTKKQSTVALYAHMICMAFAWGMVLPWGVSIASRSRNVPGQKKGGWFKVHRNLQYTGWFLQLLGFIFAIVMVEENGGIHFSPNVPHTIIGLIVVILGTLQPLNALFRLHPPDGGWPNGVKPMKRKIFEWVHKGSGRIATILGMVNVCIGAALVKSYGFDDGMTTLSLILAILGIAPVILFFVASSIKPNNAVAKFCVGAGKGNKDNNNTRVVPSKQDRDLDKRVDNAWSVEGDL
jgi:hypothetical protein